MHVLLGCADICEQIAARYCRMLRFLPVTIPSTAQECPIRSLWRLEVSQGILSRT